MGRMRISPKALSEEIDSLALKTVPLDAKDIPALGEVLKALEEVAALVGRGKPQAKLRAGKGTLTKRDAEEAFLK